MGSEDEEAVFKPTILSGLANTHDIVSDKEEMVKMQNQIQESLEKAVSDLPIVAIYRNPSDVSSIFRTGVEI